MSAAVALSVVAVLLWSLGPTPPLDRPLPAISASVSPVRADAPLRIAAFGTSLTAAPQIWPGRLEQQLNHCMDRPVTVQRIAGPGMGSAWALEQLDRVIDSAPDLILLEFSINDSDARDGISLRHSRRNHRQLIAQLQKALPQAQILLMTMSPAQGLRGLVRPRLRAYYALYAELAAEFDLGLVDLHARWRALPRAARGLETDGLHPSPDVASGLIVPALSKGLGC